MDRKNRSPLKFLLVYLTLFLSLFSCQPTTQTTEKDNGFKFYSRSMEQLQAKNYADALNYIDEAIKTSSRIAVYYELKGDIYTGMGNLVDALSAYKNAKNLRSFYPEIYVKTADIHYKRNNYDMAIKDYRKAIAQRPEEPKIYLSLILCYIQQREYDVALNLLQEYKLQATKQNQRLDPEFYILRAKIDFENAKYEDVVFSMDIARKIKKLDRNESIFYLRSLIELGRLDDAYALLLDFKETLLESDTHFIRGLYYFKQNNFKDAKIQLEMSVQKKTKIYEAYQLLAEIYRQKGDTQQADKYLADAEQYKSYRLINIGHKY